MKILLLGGYGVFGGRLAELLSDLAQVEILICGRSLPRATAFCADYRGAAQVRPLQLDRKDIAQALATERPDVVVDASGPFQDYGDDPYPVIRACIAACVDYLDFADAADFVFGVTQFDADAKQAGIFVLSGVSSFPVLTAAVLREMARTMDIVSVHGGIAPSPYAGIGLNVMRAVVGYAGAPMKLLRDGQPSHGIGLAESMRFTIAVPGMLPLRNIRFSLVDVPDLQVLPPEHPTMRDIWMGAGPVPEILHRVLNLLAKARATLHLPSFAPLSGLFYTVLNLMKFSEHRGGMFVEVTGTADGIPTTQSWHLLAEGDDGPYIPSMAVEAIVRKLLAGTRPETGARPATHALDLADYEKLFENRTIHTGFRRDPPQGTPLYHKILGTSFDRLPTPVKHLHDSTDNAKWQGQAEVRRGTGLLSRILGRIFRFPQAAPQVPVSVTFTRSDAGERWTRNFGGSVFASFQKAGKRRDDALLVESFGPVAVSLALAIENDRLFLIPRRWSVLGVPMPGFLLPSGRSFETERDGKFCFDVEIAAPVVGLIVAYRGILEPAA